MTHTGWERYKPFPYAFISRRNIYDTTRKISRVYKLIPSTQKKRLLTTVTTSIKCAHNHASIVVRAVMLSDSVIYTKKLPPSYSHACPSQTPRQA